MRRLLLAVVLLGLAAPAIQGCAGDAGTSGARGLNDPTAGCPKKNSAGNEERFLTRSWFDLFVLQRASKGDIQVSMDFADGTSTALVRLHNLMTHEHTAEAILNLQHPSQNITVPCGDWMVQVNSPGWSKISGNLTAAPL